MKVGPLLVVAMLAGAGFFGYVVYDSLRVERLEREIRNHGRPAVATVLSARQTGSWVANNPELELLLRIQEEGAPARQQQATKIVPLAAAALFQPGVEMRLRIDPKDPGAFVFDEPWDVPPDN
ncbi:hypothetical protein [Eleftheria terrae]|uniref:hypothetical protein n=1 Tax=Eleftheria terrae TaxID=1597781 RepID=UPI00263A5335|nr:hypothetical protein [Eleftheria terrae]WKB53781.1 hypothetical protein N7L95_05145 [Eleftheria terrae]